MSEQTTVPRPLMQGGDQVKTSKKNVNIVKISDVLAITLKYWYWVVISVIVCVGLGVLYVLSTQPTYTSSCAVMIRDDAQSPMGSASVDLEDLGILNTNTVLEDEIAALKSPDLMQVVVEKLGLDVSYYTPGTFHDKVLYGSDVPVRVTFPDMPSDEAASLKIKVDEKGKITVEDLVVNERNLVVNPATPIEFGAGISTPSGIIMVEKTPFFKEGKPVEEIINKMPIASAVGVYSGKISIENPAKKSNVVTIICNDQNLTRANDILSALINAYNQNWINAKAQVVATTNEFITERLNAVEAELGSVDNNISAFKSSNLIPDLSQASSIYMQESNQTNNQIMNMNNQLQMTRYLRNYIQTEGSHNQVLPVNTGIANTNIEALIGEYNAAMLQRNQHVSNSSESNPIVIEYDSRLAALRRSILSSIDNQDVALSTTIRNLERNEQSATARVAANPRQARILLSSERQQKVQESLYLYLLQKREENELSQAFTSVNTRIIRKPSGGGPTSPKSVQICLIAFCIGLAIPFGVVYVTEASNTKVRGRKDVEDIAIPIIGEIPRFKHARKVDVSYFSEGGKHRDRESLQSDIVVEEGNRNLVNEAFRVLRTNVNFITADSTQSTIMMTSFNPGSGKTCITVNLGISLALKEKKVLLVDCDLRRATLSRFTGSPHKGISEYLAGAIHDVDPVIQRDTFIKGLDILPVGTIPPNPTELLESKRLANLIEYLRSEYEVILIDCPPVEMMADAQIVSSCCDRTFFVVRVGLFERAMLNNLERLYNEKKYPNMSIILNDSSTGTRYGYTYRYGYGYGSKGYNHYAK